MLIDRVCYIGVCDKFGYLVRFTVICATQGVSVLAGMGE
jgi:hypothetical protein